MISEFLVNCVVMTELPVVLQMESTLQWGQGTTTSMSTKSAMGDGSTHGWDDAL